jgi:hypothetical protein
MHLEYLFWRTDCVPGATASLIVLPTSQCVCVASSPLTRNHQCSSPDSFDNLVIVSTFAPCYVYSGIHQRFNHLQTYGVPFQGQVESFNHDCVAYACLSTVNAGWALQVCASFSSLLTTGREIILHRPSPDITCARVMGFVAMNLRMSSQADVAYHASSFKNTERSN